MSETKEESTMCTVPGLFSWNELVTTDVAAATSFYTGLFGWKTEKFGGGMDYSFFKQGDSTAGGMMKAPKPGMPAQWLAYITVEDVDASAAKVTKLGGKICAPPFDVQGVGRIAVATDPQGAAFGLFQPAT